jgi:hypothetical protein
MEHKRRALVIRTAAYIGLIVVGALHARVYRRRSVAVEQIYRCAFSDGVEHAWKERAEGNFAAAG